jgi:nicotinamidase-related amidase
LVLVDLQQDFWPEEVASTAPELPARIADLLTYARANDLTVVHVRARFDADGGNWMARYRLLGRIPCVDGTAGADTLPFACEADGEPVVIKHSFDGFLNTELHELLTARGISGLLIGGLVTSTCVLFTATTATQLGYLVSVLGDCCSDYEGAHKATLAAYPYVFDVVPSTEISERRESWNAQLETMHPTR